MNDYLLLATADDLGVFVRAGDGWRALRRGLAGREVLCVIAREGVLRATVR